MVSVEAVLADRAYDSDAILAWITEQGAVPVIPPHPSRAGTRKSDWCLYKEFAWIECLFGKMKHFRRVFSRFDKPGAISRSFISSLSASCFGRMSTDPRAHRCRSGAPARQLRRMCPRRAR